VADLAVLLLGHAHTPLEHRPTLTLVGLLDPALVAVEDDSSFRGADAGLLADGKDQFLAQVELATLLRVAPLGAGGEQGVGVRSANPFGESSSTVKSAASWPGTIARATAICVTPGSSRAFWISSPTRRPLPCSSAWRPRPLLSTENHWLFFTECL